MYEVVAKISPRGITALSTYNIIHILIGLYILYYCRQVVLYDVGRVYTIITHILLIIESNFIIKFALTIRQTEISISILYY